MPIEVASYGFVVLSIVGLVWHDRIVSRRLEPATIWGTAVIIATSVVAEVLARNRSNFSPAHQRLGRPFARSAYLAVRSMTTKRRQAWR